MKWIFVIFYGISALTCVSGSLCWQNARAHVWLRWMSFQWCLQCKCVNDELLWMGNWQLTFHGRDMFCTVVRFGLSWHLLLQGTHSLPTIKAVISCYATVLVVFCSPSFPLWRQKMLFVLVQSNVLTIADSVLQRFRVYHALTGYRQMRQFLWIKIVSPVEVLYESCE